MLIDPGRVGNGNVMPLQEEHDVLDLLLVRPSLTRSRSRAPVISHDDLQGVRPEGIDDELRVLWPDALDEPGAQIFLDAVDRGRQGFLKGHHLELAAVFAVDLPPAAQRQHGTDMRVRHHAYDGHRI